MKAVEYYEEYGEKLMADYNVTSEMVMDNIIALFIAFCDEVSILCETRKVRTNEAVASILKEQNQKWNALCWIFVKKHGFSPITDNGFIAYWRREFPEYVHARLI